MTTTSPGPLVRLAVRRRLKDHLDGTRHSRAEVTEMMAAVGDDAIDHAAAEVGVGAPAGGFIQWLTDHASQIAAIVKLILAALGVA